MTALPSKTLLILMSGGFYSAFSKDFRPHTSFVLVSEILQHFGPYMSFCHLLIFHCIVLISLRLRPLVGSTPMSIATTALCTH